MKPGLHLLIAIIFLAACIPHPDQPLTGKVEKPSLLTNNETISELRLTSDLPKDNGDNARVFELASKRISARAEKLLRREKRWNEEEGLVLNIKIVKVYLRHSLTVLLLWEYADADEISVRAWITRDGAIVATETLTSLFGYGGVYATLPPRRRVEILSDQIAKIVVSRL